MPDKTETLKGQIIVQLSKILIERKLLRFRLFLVTYYTPELGWEQRRWASQNDEYICKEHGDEKVDTSNKKHTTNKNSSSLRQEEKDPDEHENYNGGVGV